MRISDWSSDVCSSDLKRESLLKALPWLLLAAAFLLLSLDEAISLHEWLSAAIGARVNNTGIFYFVWAAPALVLCLAGLACFLPFILGFKGLRSEEHTSELQSLMRISYAVFCLKKKNTKNKTKKHNPQ